MSKANKKRRPHKKKQKRGTEEAQCNAVDTNAQKEAEPANTGSFETENLQGVKEISDSRCTEDHSGLLPYDETLLDVCRSRWQFADWQGNSQTGKALPALIPNAFSTTRSEGGSPC